MSRIRTIKPEFFRHEGLQDIEAENPGSYAMMVFAGLWGHCDSKGRFEWKPRILKLDILPFLPFVMADTLDILERAGMVVRYTVDGKEYGEIPSFEKHQRITGKEAQDGEKHPKNNGESPGKHQGNIVEIPNVQEGKGREKEKEKERNGLPEKFPVAVAPLPEKTESALQAACRATFSAYQAAYANRYGQPHVDNVKTRSQIRQFVQRLGYDESPQVAAWFVGHPGQFYTQNMHGVGSLLRDCEKLRTEWATGHVMTQGKARQSDRSGTNGAALAEVLAGMVAA